MEDTGKAAGRQMWYPALVLWKGPESLSILDDTDSAFLFGWQVLRLALRVDTSGTRSMRLESRAVYADTRSEQPMAILRAVYWASRVPGYPFQQAPVAARFVKIPMALTEQWVTTFEGLSLGVQRAFDEEAPIHTLRVEWDYVTSAFEVVWQGGKLEHSDLARAWETVWHDMGMALESSPPVRDVEEDWPRDLTHFESQPFTTSQTSAITGYTLDTYPPLDQQEGRSPVG